MNLLLLNPEYLLAAVTLENEAILSAFFIIFSAIMDANSGSIVSNSHLFYQTYALMGTFSRPPNIEQSREVHTAFLHGLVG